jgi:hypothetical protein
MKEGIQEFRSSEVAGVQELQNFGGYPFSKRIRLLNSSET